MKSYDWEGSDVWTGDADALVRGVARGGAREPRARRDDRRLLAQRRRDLGHRHEARLTRVARAPRTIDRSTARRLAVAAQRLSGTPPRSSPRRRARRDPLDPVRAARPDRGRRAEPAPGARQPGRGVRPQAPGPAAVARPLGLRVLGARGLDRPHRGPPDPRLVHAGYLRDDGSEWNRDASTGWRPTRSSSAPSRADPPRRPAARPPDLRRLDGRVVALERLDERAQRRPDARVPVDVWARSWSPAARASRSSGT